MKITSLVENTSAAGLPVEHGLSLYVRLNGVDGQTKYADRAARNILFDMGQRRLFAENAERLGLRIADVDVAILSHGHYDHGGGLRAFLELNSRAAVYVHRDAFQPHYSLRETGLAYIGIEQELQRNERLLLCGSFTKIDDGVSLFADVRGGCCFPRGNRLLFGPDESVNDTFTHEQNLVVEEEGKVVLFAGCAHNGMVNILRKAEAVTGKKPTHVFGGMHLVKSGLSEVEEDAFIAELAERLMAYEGCKFYTMHCTGVEQFEKLKAIMGGQIDYLACGDTVCI